MYLLNEIDRKRIYLMASKYDQTVESQSCDKPTTDSSKLKFIDLFCGMGGFHQALANLGHECVYACDIDKNCRNVYSDNYNIEPDGDINKVIPTNIPHFDILCAGFSCQPFSKSGAQQGFDDVRGNVFFDICRIAEHHKLSYH